MYKKIKVLQIYIYPINMSFNKTEYFNNKFKKMKISVRQEPGMAVIQSSDKSTD